MTEYTRDTLRAIAATYTDLPHEPSRPEVVRAYLALATDLQAQWSRLRVSNLRVEFSDTDPYPCSADMFEDMRAGTLCVFTGSDLPSNHPMASIYIDGRPMNLIFRAIHDAEHFALSAPFGPRGELATWRAHVRQCSTWDSVRAISTETLAQNACYNFGPAPGTFADQKATIIPDALIVRALDCARGVEVGRS